MYKFCETQNEWLLSENNVILDPLPHNSLY